MVIKTWRGWCVEKKDSITGHALYLQYVHNGAVAWTLDYAHARYYTAKSTATKYDKMFTEVIR